MSEDKFERHGDEPGFAPIATTSMDAQAQSDMASELQAMLLRRYWNRLKDGTISDTGMAALQRLLQQNGWSLDPAKLPKGLGDLLTSKIAFDGDDDESQVIGSISKAV